ncbi:phage portal protein [Bacillus cereus]
MGLFDWLEKRSADGTVTESTSYTDALSSLLSKETITEEKVMKIPTAKKCVDTITKTIAQMPVYLYKENADGSIVRVLEDDKYNRVRLLNDESNDYTLGINLKRHIAKDVLLHGKSYTKIEFVGNNVLSLHPINATSITVNKRIKNGYDVVGADILLNSTENGAFNTVAKKQPIYKAHDFIIVTNDYADGLSGIGALKHGENIFRLALAEMEYTTNYFETGALPVGILYSEDGRHLNDKEKNSLREAWQRLYGGVKNAFKTVVLPSGMKYQPMAQPMLATENMRNSFADDICKVFNVPYGMISTDGKQYQSLAQNNKSFLTNTLSPIIGAMESAFDKALLLESEKDKGYFFRFDTSELLRATKKEQVEMVALGLEKGIFTINDGRAMLDLPPIDDDVFMWNLSSVLYNPKTGEMKVPNMGLIDDKKESPKVLESEEPPNGE